MAGYSDTPLDRKLGLAANKRLRFVHAPDSYFKLLPKTYSQTADPTHKPVGWIQAFYTSADDLQNEFPTLRASLMPDGQLWVAWPKKASGVASDLSDNAVREIGLRCGLVDVKIAAIDDTWSAMKFVYRRRDR